MKVRWSSTYLMLDRAERNKPVSTWKRRYHWYSCCSQFVDTFVDELRWEETDTSKRDKIRALKLDDNEWQRVNVFLGLLTVYTTYSHSLKHLTHYCQHADNAQQAFSSDQASTLHLAIPALEALHRAWSSRAGRPKYERFAPALEAACRKIEEYYEKTAESPAYIMAMSMSLLFVLMTLLM